MSRIRLAFLILAVQAALCLYFSLRIEVGNDTPDIPIEYYILLLVSFLTSLFVYYTIFSIRSKPIATFFIVATNMVLPIIIISSINIEAGFHIAGNLDIEGNQIVDNDLINGIYFSIVTFTTLGYGDVQPIPQMKVFSSLVAICGYINLGLLISLVSHKASN